MSFKCSGTSPGLKVLVSSLALALSLLFPTLSSSLANAFQATAPEIHATRQLEFPFIPDASMTEGTLCTKMDRDYERPRYAEQIPYCRRNVSRETKADIYSAYGVPEKCRKEYTIDHFIPLSIGGNNEIKNLWPEHKSIKSLRQHLEERLYKQISQGLITQDEAVKIIVNAKWNPPVRDPSSFSFCDHNRRK